jgi:hypothetical protein
MNIHSVVRDGSSLFASTRTKSCSRMGRLAKKSNRIMQNVDLAMNTFEARFFSEEFPTGQSCEHAAVFYRLLYKEHCKAREGQCWC